MRLNLKKLIYTVAFYSLLLVGFMWFFNSVIAPPFYRKANLPAYGKFSNPNAPLPALIRLANVRGAFCSGFVIDSNYALTAAHCLDRDNPMVNIQTIGGRDTGVVAETVGINNRMDIGLLKGNFSRFKNYKVDFYGFSPTNVNHGEYGQFVTCGFPYLQKKETCNVFVPRSNEGFYLAGSGFLIPGMSGGPVIDVKNKYVIGVNSAMGSGAAFITPVLGALGAFRIEP